MNPTTRNPFAPPVLAPSFTLETAVRKVRTAEGAWNPRDPDRVALFWAAPGPRPPDHSGILDVQ
jgi:hypothetical protein